MAKIYLSSDNLDDILDIPVLPEKFTMKTKGDNKTYDLLNFGEINILNNPKLQEIEIESFFPISYAPYVTSKILKEPKEYINKIMEWWKNKKAIRITCSDMAFSISELVSIEDLEYFEQGGAVGDIYYKLKLKEYKAFSAKKVEISTITNENTNNNNNNIVVENRPQPNNIPAPYTVKRGDCLWNICKKFLGDGNKCWNIASLNGIKNASLIYPGQVIRFG